MREESVKKHKERHRERQRGRESQKERRRTFHILKFGLRWGVNEFRACMLWKNLMIPFLKTKTNNYMNCSLKITLKQTLR